MKKTIIIIILIIIPTTVLLSCSCKSDDFDVEEPQIIEREYEDPILRRKLDGAPVANEEQANLFPVAIMVENAADAWPLSGLDKAQIVIEALAESSITRFVAIYANDQEIDKIGPVRSARPYYLDWIEPFEPVYMHVGGAPQALTKLRSGDYDIIDLDQFFHSQYFWRDNKWRYAPHNVFTSSELINKALEERELSDDVDVQYQMWKYKEDLELEQRPEDVEDIKIAYTADLYHVTWKYNRKENNYIRWQNHQLYKMSDNEWIKSKNIIVQVNSMTVIDDVGRKDIETVGDGDAWIFFDGQMIEGKWQKDSKTDRTKYYDLDDNEIEFNGGITWIEIIPDADYLTYQDQ